MKWRCACIAGMMIGLAVLPFAGVAATIRDDECVNVEFVWLRGSGQDYGKGKEREAYGARVAAAMEADRVLATYRFYEVDYAALDIDIETAVDAFLSAGTEKEYGESVNFGVTNLVAHVRRMATACPGQKFVLAGYSQGAQVVGESLAELTDLADRVAHVALLGDPKGYLPEGFSAWPALPAFCDGKGLPSAYRAWAPDCKTYQGALLGRRPYIPNGWGGRVGLYCNEHDFICGSGSSPIDNSGHTKYAEVMETVAEHAVTKVAESYPRGMSAEMVATLSGWAELQPQMEIVFLVDSSESMRKNLDKVRGKIAELAEFVLASGGRVALAEFAGAGAADYPRLLCDFTCAPAEFHGQLWKIVADGKHTAIRGLRDALVLTYEKLDWRRGTAKSAVVITDSWGLGEANYADMLHKSYALGGVNTYIASWKITIDHEDLVDDTGGRYVALGGDARSVGERFDQIVDAIVGRPVALLEEEIYYPALEQPIWFDASTSHALCGEIKGYIWDIHGDGEYGKMTSEERIRWTWQTKEGAGEDYVVMHVEDIDGRRDIYAAKILVDGVAPEEDPETIEDEDDGDTERKHESGDGFALDLKENGVNADEWIEESRMPDEHKDDMNIVSKYFYKKAEDALEGILGTELSEALGKEPAREIVVEDGVDLEVAETGMPEKKTGLLGWAAPVITFVVTGAGAAYEAVVGKRRGQ